MTLTFQEALNKNVSCNQTKRTLSGRDTNDICRQVLLLPMGRADDGAHSINEKIDKANYIDGIKLLASVSPYCQILIV